MTDSLESLLEQLQSDGFPDYIQAGASISQFGSEAVPPLLEILADESRENMWWLVAETLGKIGDKRALEPLIAILKRPQTFPTLLRKYTAWALGDLGDPRAVNVLIDMMHDRDWAEDDDDELYQTDEPDNDNVEAAAWALSRIGKWEGIQAVIEILLEGNWWYDHRMGEWGGEEAFQYLLTALSSEDSTRRGCAASLLGEFGDKRAIEPLFIMAHTDPDERVRRSATYGLSALKEPDELTGLLVAFERDQFSYPQLVPYYATKINEMLRPEISDVDQAIRRERMIYQTKRTIGEAKLANILDDMLQNSLTMRAAFEFVSGFYPYLSANLLREQLASTLRTLAQDGSDETILVLVQAALAALEKRLN